MRIIWVAIILAACGQPGPKTPQSKSPVSTPVTALREAKFDLALREGSAVLAREPNNAEAAAVRAIARYQRASSQLVTDLTGVIASAEGLRYFDHERGRAIWRTFLGELEAVDSDLAIVANDPSFALELCLACWEHDWNGNGRVDDSDRKMFELEFDGKGGVLHGGDPRRRPTYRFDHGDALWGRAMISFQRAAVELVLAYRWSELDKLFHGRDRDGDKRDGALNLNIKLVDAGRVKHARDLFLAGLAFSNQEREAYLAETDDDREWVPSPRQKSYAMPLAVDAELFQTWALIAGDVMRLLDSQEGLSLREVAAMVIGKTDAERVPNAYVDVGRLLLQPQDIVIDINDDLPPAQMYERMLRGLLGHGYAESMRASPLVGRLRHMKEALSRGEDTLERKLRYLLWVN